MSDIGQEAEDNEWYRRFKINHKDPEKVEEMK